MEIVLIDDGSTDNSAEVIDAFCRRHDYIRLIRHAVNRGPYEAVQTGLAAARGEFLLLAAADDFVLPELLTRAEAALRAHPQAAFFCSEVILFDRDGRIVGLRPVAPPRLTSGYVSPADVRREIKRTDNWFIGPSVVYRRRPLADIGYFDASLGTLCDGLAQRLLAFDHGFYFDAEILAVWMVDPSSMSARTSLSVSESRRVIDAGTRWISDRFPADVRVSYGELFGRRLRFNMARQCLIQRDREPDAGVICGLLNSEPAASLLIRLLCRLPLIGPTLVLVLMTFRLRPMSIASLLRSWRRTKLSRRAERAALRRQIAQLCYSQPV